MELNYKKVYIVNMIVLIFLLLFSAGSVFGETLPAWFLPLRDAVYGQTLTTEEIIPLYQETVNKAKSAFSGPALYIMLSRCENLMGLAYRDAELKNQAASHYAEGITWAEKALEERASAEAWQMLAENISQSCAVLPTSYAVANGLKVERYSKNALAINSRNSAAQYLIAARWIYAPFPLHNFRRGIEMMTAILSESDIEKDDLFRVQSAIGYAYLQQKNNTQARQWLLKSLDVYPTNKYVQSLLPK